jgi:transposase InsO family protein
MAAAAASTWRFARRPGSPRPEPSRYDNALAESIIGLYKARLIRHRDPWHSVPSVEAATAWWAGWFNNRRLYRPLGDIPPAEYERNWLEGQQP